MSKYDLFKGPPTKHDWYVQVGDADPKSYTKRLWRCGNCGRTVVLRIPPPVTRCYPVEIPKDNR